MFSEDNAIKIAKIVKSFGTNGELTLRLYDTFPDKIDYEEPMFVFVNELLVPLFISSFSKKGANKAVVIFDDINSEYRAKELIGCEIVSFQSPEDDSEDNNDDDEFMYEDFIGYEFLDSTTQTKGTIEDFIDNELNPLFVIETEDGEHYIPAHDDIIENIDSEKRVITFSLAEGILDINK